MNVVRDPTCALCRDDGGEVLWRDADHRVVFVDEPSFPGFVRVVLDAHVAEFGDLAPAARGRLMNVVAFAERAVRDTVRPDKVNLASLGNLVPHVHWHVIPRWRSDRNFPDSIWAHPRREGTVPTVDDLRRALRERLNSLLPPSAPTEDGCES